jgi:hypothetical protein
MHVSRTPLALAALLLVAACGTSSEIVAPESTLKSGGWIGSGNAIAESTFTAERGIGWSGSSNAVEPSTSPTTERGGLGLMGSGNAIASDSTSTAERGGLGMTGSGN